MLVRKLLILVTLCSFSPVSAGQPVMLAGVDADCPFERARAEAAAEAARAAAEPAIENDATAAVSLFNASRSAPALMP